ncbi:MAG TPA: N-acetylmuramoyl-L-alanine amidase [Streptomyces sp.]|nr:N-acetylmuramoyl-L-alanine amidase [Streptomyces sp.]
MSAPMSGRTLAEMLRAEGVKVAEHPGWLTHNRNHKGAWGEVHGVMVHHTVTGPRTDAVALCYNGRSTLPGPLCHGVIERDGTVHLVGNGRANHAGGGDPRVLAAVVDERSPLPKPQMHDGSPGAADGNRAFYGFECANLGDGKDPWPPVQVEAIVKAAAAVCRYYGWSAKSVIGHSEWSDWKSDPRGPVGVKGSDSVSMADIRRRVQERLNHEPSWSPGGSTPTPAPRPTKPPVKDDMEPIEFWNYRNAIADAASVEAGKGRIPDAYGYLTQTHAHVQALITVVDSLRKEVAALKARLDTKP